MTYEERRAARIERLRERAERKESEANAHFEKARTMSSVIPMGQPILIGHHSENKDRRYRDKIHNTMGKGVELSSEAERLRERAEAAENNNAIFSDDPEAVTKLKKKLEELQNNQELMKNVNSILRKKSLSEEQKKEQIIKAGLSEGAAKKIMEPDWLNRVGFQSYSLSNNNANIKRVKDRIAHLEKINSIDTTTKNYGDVSIIENVEENRCQIFFPDKPSEECRKELKSKGFRWSPRNGCWQRHRSNIATRYADNIIRKYYGEAPENVKEEEKEKEREKRRLENKVSTEELKNVSEKLKNQFGKEEFPSNVSDLYNHPNFPYITTQLVNEGFLTISREVNGNLLYKVSENNFETMPETEPKKEEKEETPEQKKQLKVLLN